jgi:hypothetical protein
LPTREDRLRRQKKIPPTVREIAPFYSQSALNDPQQATGRPTLETGLGSFRFQTIMSISNRISMETVKKTTSPAIKR